MNKIAIKSKWVSNDNLQYLEIISINKSDVFYKDVLNNSNLIRSNSFNDFIKHNKLVDLDTPMYNGIPSNYLGKSQFKRCDFI